MLIPGLGIRGVEPFMVYLLCRWWMDRDDLLLRPVVVAALERQTIVVLFSFWLILPNRVMSCQRKNLCLRTQLAGAGCLMLNLMVFGMGFRLLDIVVQISNRSG